jgi:glycogen debranching enzyme
LPNSVLLMVKPSDFQSRRLLDARKDPCNSGWINSRHFKSRRFFSGALVAIVLCACSLSLAAETAGQPKDKPLELSRAVRPWEFMSVLGTRSALLGNESGQFEAWAYPLKIFRDFHLNFRVGGQVVPADRLARSVIVRPESTTILYASDTFSVTETLFVPISEPGAVIKIDVETTEPLEVEAAFERDFQLEWPAAMGGSSIDWNPTLHAFVMSEEQGKFDAIVGSPSATDFQEEYQTNYSSSRQNSFRLGITAKGRATKIIAIAASPGDHTQTIALYGRLCSHYADVLGDASRYYQDYLNRTVRLTLPDSKLEQAYDWAQVSMIQGLVQNPFLGTGLVAGYKTSADDQRPGYGWFFGRDALWTSFALDSTGDFTTTRTALEFLTKYQRADGKVTHEIAQGASFVPWFTSMPFAYAAADATPLYIVAINEYVVHSGDLEFARQHWDHIWSAYQFLLSTYDERGLPQNAKVGHGWVEGGPLLPVKGELYQSSVGLEAVRSLASLAHLLNKDDLSQSLNETFEKKKTSLNQIFWIPQKEHYALAVDAKNAQVDTPSVLATVPMWFGLLDSDKAELMINQLSDPSYQTDWGMRIISSLDPKYDPGGYHSGTVWPLFTGWASVGEYQYHRSIAGYSNLRSNALLTFDGALGHVTEVLSGNYFQTLADGSPHQIWSSAMVVSPLLRGLFGLEVNALERTVAFRPHVPPDWTSFAIENVKVGSTSLNLHYSKTGDAISLTVDRVSGGVCDFDFSPALSPRAKVEKVLLNGHSLSSHLESNPIDQHLLVHFPVTEKSQRLVIEVRDDFGLVEPVELPLLASTSRGVRITSESWTPSRDMLNLVVAGRGGEDYSISIWNPRQITSVEGADLIREDQDHAKLHLRLPAAQGGVDPQLHVAIHFQGKLTEHGDGLR